MKSLVDITPADMDASKSILICEVNSEGLSFAIKQEETNTYTGVTVLQVNARATEDYTTALQSEMKRQQWLDKPFKKVYIMYSFAESVLVPFSLYNLRENKNVLNCIHGDFDENTSVLTDMIIPAESYNVYRIPTPVLDIITSVFPVAEHRHQYTVLLNNVSTEDNCLQIIFYPNKIVLLLRKDSKCKFVNTFFYETAEDVSYILLNVCKQFDAADIPVVISGLIEKNSAMYNEIYKYFNVVTLSQLPAGCNYAEEIATQPPHYFSHIFVADSCE